ncbi:hypothetical protein WMY93_028721 [Mugilogobius chulae]|uniref:RIIa domain-containing protein n=1 Tax=Mugilogobius chulae TaxID=88201 RepID=A0AAW0MP37_9GOBI
MAMPISNTHLRVPRGFGALLEGLTREILRDQPKDIPKYSANYFENLLEQREEKGTDPSEWAAKLEDRYYNNHSFKSQDHAPETAVSNSQDSTAEDYSGQSQGDVSMDTIKNKHLNTSENKESSPIKTQAESGNEPVNASGDPSLSSKFYPSTTSNQENSESQNYEVQLLSEKANIKIQESNGESEDDDGQELMDQEDKPGNDNICSADLEQEATDAASITDEDAEQKCELRQQTPISQLEIIEQKSEQLASNGVTTSHDFEETNKDESLVEISFEDVPDIQQSMNDELRINAERREITDVLSNAQEVQLVEEKLDDDTEDNISNHDASMEESIGIIDPEHQSTTLADHLVDEDTNQNNDENSSLKDKLRKCSLTEETTTIVEQTNNSEIEDNQEMDHQKLFDKDVASELTQLIDSNVQMLEEHQDKSEDDFLENNDEEQYQEETLDKYFTVSQDQHSEEGLSDSEVKEGHSSHVQDNVNLDLEEWPDKEDKGLQEEQQDTLYSKQPNEEQEECSRPQEEEDIMDIPLDDPEANRAAAKIQAGFRGHMTRKKMKPEDKTEGEERQEDRGQ